MQVGLQCWTCRRGRVRCDGSFPGCKLNGAGAAGHDAGGGQNEHVPNGGQEVVTGFNTSEFSGSYEELGSELAHFTSDQVLEPTATRSPVFHQPTPALYRKAQMIFEGLDYCESEPSAAAERTNQQAQLTR